MMDSSAVALVIAHSIANTESVGPDRNALFSDHNETEASWVVVKLSLLVGEAGKSEVLETFPAVVDFAKFDLHLVLLRWYQLNSESFVTLRRRSTIYQPVFQDKHQLAFVVVQLPILDPRAEHL